MFGAVIVRFADSQCRLWDKLAREETEMLSRALSAHDSALLYCPMFLRCSICF